jgi:hypothetical protein
MAKTLKEILSKWSELVNSTKTPKEVYVPGKLVSLVV